MCIKIIDDISFIELIQFKVIFLCEFNSYIDSSGVSGEIPSTFANLQRVRDL